MSVLWDLRSLHKQNVGASSSSVQASRQHSNVNDLLLAILCLLLLEVVAFGINVGRVGVYQDEWIYFGKAHFDPHTFFSLVSTYMYDPRMVVRPLEPLYYSLLYFFVWEKPLWYHLLNYACEFLSAVFLYLSIVRLSNSRVVSISAAALFLLYPNHDSTHYSIVCSSLHASVFCFMLSWWLFTKGLSEHKYGLILWSSLAYFLSIYRYELTLPWVVLYPAAYFIQSKNDNLSLRNWRHFFSCQLPFLIVAASMVVYRAWLLPSLHIGWQYKTCFNLPHFLSVIGAGLNVSFSPYLYSFFNSMIVGALKDGLSIFSWCCLLLASIAIAICCLKPSVAVDNRTKHGIRAGLVSLALGIIILPASYAIYGISPEHMPVVDAWLNRVNIGGSLGASLIIAGILSLAASRIGLVQKTLISAVYAVMLSALACSFIVVDWQFAKPWIVSWQAQKQLINFIGSHAAEIHSEDSIIIGGISRYVNKWAPVVDGVWDFQNIVRTTLNNNHVNANVVTERLTIVGDKLEDRYGTGVLGAYPFEHMILYAPNKSRWVRISTREQFIKQAKEFGWLIADEHGVCQTAAERQGAGK